MNKKLKHLAAIVLLTTLATSAGAQQQSYPYLNPQLPIEQRVNDLISRMTPEEKVSQMMNSAAAIERLGVPAYNWWSEALHGVARAGSATVFPQAIAMAATFDDQAVQQAFDIVSTEARAKYNDFQAKKDHQIYHGLSFWTPNINIFRDPRWGRGQETYGEDPYLTSQMGLAVVRGLQGNDSKYFKSIACAKHYAVHSGPESTRHSFDAEVSPRDLWETYLPAFETLVKEGNVQQVMCAYNRFEGKPCCGSDKLLVNILRNDWGYKSIVVSDCGAINDFYEIDKRTPRHDTHPDAESASTDAVLNGTDVECGNSYKSLDQALKDGKIKESDLDVSLRRLFTARFQLGMFDPDDQVPFSKLSLTEVESKTHVAKSLEMARKSIVLLKNNNILPLSKDLKRIAVVGPNANDAEMLWANYNGTPNHTETILSGLINKMPNAEIIYEKGCGLTSSDKIEVNTEATVNHVKDADVIIFVGGISPRLEGEEMPVKIDGFSGGDRTSIDLPAVQEKMLKALKATGKPVIMILCTGSAIALNWENDNLDAIVNAWYGGQEAGTAVADVLFGDYNPAGRLPITFYKSVNQLPDFSNYNMKGRTYRYMTEKPLYPFGYGLSYTTFEYGDAQLSAPTISKTDNVTLSFKLSNTGKRNGDEVAQIYIKSPNDPSAPIKALKAFKRIHINAGESADVTFTLSATTFRSFNDKHQDFEIRPGKYQILYGGSSADSALKSIELKIKK